MPLAHALLLRKWSLKIAASGMVVLVPAWPLPTTDKKWLFYLTTPSAYMKNATKKGKSLHTPCVCLMYPCKILSLSVV